MPSRVRALTITAFALCLTVFAHAQDGEVKVTAARANIRADANDQAAVLTQLPAGTVLSLKAIEGDWFRVEVHIGSIRVQAYLSKKVATLITAPQPVALASAGLPAPAGDNDHVRDGMSVALQVGRETTWLLPESASVRVIDPDVSSVRALVGVLPMDPAARPTATGASPVTFAWVLDGRTAASAVDDRRPTFLVTFKGVPGFAADALTPTLIRLTPAPSGVRLVAADRGRADQASRADADWDVMRDFKQETVRATIEIVEPGAARIQPASALEAGEYAIVVRPAGRARLSGASVLAGNGGVFRPVWAFSIR